MEEDRKGDAFLRATSIDPAGENAFVLTEVHSNPVWMTVYWLNISAAKSEGWFDGEKSKQERVA